MVAHQGVDSVTVDLQHGAIDFSSAFQMLQAISTSPAIPLVRVPGNEPGIMTKMLDAGTYGIICPMIETEACTAQFVAACRYPPLGERSYGPNRVSFYAGSDYARDANTEILGLIAAIHTDGGATARQRFADGFQLCSLPTDVRLLVNAVKSEVAAAKS